MEKEMKADIVKKYGRKEGDTGSPEVQIALLTERIKNLTEHIKVNKQDLHSRRGLTQMVATRKKLLGYYKDNNLEGYRELIKKLNIRK